MTLSTYHHPRKNRGNDAQREFPVLPSHEYETVAVEPCPLQRLIKLDLYPLLIDLGELIRERLIGLLRGIEPVDDEVVLQCIAMILSTIAPPMPRSYFSL